MRTRWHEHPHPLGGAFSCRCGEPDDEPAIVRVGGRVIGTVTSTTFIRAPQEKTMSNDEPKCDVLGQPWKPDPDKGKAASPRYAEGILRERAVDGPPEGFAATRLGERMMAADQREELRKLKGQAESPRYAIPILRHFQYGHMPPKQADLTRDFLGLAQRIVNSVQNGPERQVALRKLLEAKDAAVRAVLEES